MDKHEQLFPAIGVAMFASIGLDMAAADFTAYRHNDEKSPKDKKTLKRRAKNKAARKARKK